MRRNTLTKSSGGGSIRNVMQFSKMLILVILVIQPRRVPTVPQTKIKSIGKASEEQDEQAPRDRSKTKKLNRDRSSNLNLYD